MSERVSKENVVKEEGYLYFLDKEGYTCRAPMKSVAFKKLSDDLKLTEGKLAELTLKRMKLSKEVASRAAEVKERSKMLEEVNSDILINETRAVALRAEISKEEARAAHLDQERQRIMRQKTDKEQQLEDLESELAR